ncbi:hypothetical protein [Psychrobacter phenylpyruvicus]|uniref:Uncharacterized protein n=1 Tax=Psychrobacter phenylpyruvicus TaxID=29432 RepID=A0A379LNT1_9GAMM|nr:hypothetical protein [Psychrobacter phenylpyruvicus]SUD91765.1 Uncharacterised protein [Psychrobacter phenylpyruvicus]
MIYEFIATITAGFGMAGIAMIIRHLTKFAGIPTPKWLIPIFAAIGMLGFQIHQEYNWQQQQIDRLPEQVKVIKTVEGQVWYRPWSYLKPQVIRFMAVEVGQPLGSDINPTTQDIRHSNIYLFERRMSTKIIPQLVNCQQPAITSLTTKAPLSAATFKQLQWQPLTADDEILQVVCQ